MEYNQLVSVVMPVYNGEEYLKEAIDSILTQTYTNFELLFVINCSTDSSLGIIKAYNDRRIKIIFEDNCGIVQAYNRCFKEAKGDLILIHDQDDISLKDRLQSQINYLIKNDLDICGSGFSIINKEGEIVKHIYPPTEKKDMLNTIIYDFYTLFNPTVILKKKVLQQQNYFNEKLQVGADIDFFLRSILTYNCGNNPRILLKYRHHLNSTSKKNTNERKSKDLDIALNYVNKFSDKVYDINYALSKLYYYYNRFFKSNLYLFRSLVTKGFSIFKIKQLMKSTIFALPIYLFRRGNFFFNKRFNKFLYSIKKYS